MRVQSIENQQSFAASACFQPLAPINLRRLITPEIILNARKKTHSIGAMRETDLLEELKIGQLLNVDDLLENLQLAVNRGHVKRSSQLIVPPRYYTEARAFELNGDTLVLYSKPNFYDGSVGAASKIEIEHVANGFEGTTHIVRNYSFTEEDEDFDALAKALNELSE